MNKATETETNGSVSVVMQIGDTAGVVWRTLAENGPLTMAKLVKKVGGSRDTVMQALGWLAREEKIEMRDERHTRIIALR